MIGSIDEQLNGCPFKATLQQSRQDSRININSIFESEPERQNCFQLPFCFQAIIIFVVVATMVLGWGWCGADCRELELSKVLMTYCRRPPNRITISVLLIEQLKWDEPHNFDKELGHLHPNKASLRISVWRQRRTMKFRHRLWQLLTKPANGGPTVTFN